MTAFGRKNSNPTAKLGYLHWHWGTFAPAFHCWKATGGLILLCEPQWEATWRFLHPPKRWGQVLPGGKAPLPSHPGTLAEVAGWWFTAREGVQPQFPCAVTLASRDENLLRKKNVKSPRDGLHITPGRAVSQLGQSASRAVDLGQGFEPSTLTHILEPSLVFHFLNYSYMLSYFHCNSWNNMQA